MSFINIEIKARTRNADVIRKFLLDHHAEFRGTDLQTDTYFNVPAGRLKLRQGNIENNLIFYERENTAGPKRSDFQLVAVQDSEALLVLLTKAIGIKVKVVKKREIYFIGNIKFHIDKLEELGSFVEIEASNKEHNISVEELQAQCNQYIAAFGINKEDMLSNSYSDMLLDLSNS